MSVLIKGMDMPEYCFDCRFHKLLYCTLTDICTNTAQGCPLVEVSTPHGRLIDADAFEANIQNEWERNEVSNSEWIHFREMINAEPTIIEAEE